MDNKTFARQPIPEQQDIIYNTLLSLNDHDTFIEHKGDNIKVFGFETQVKTWSYKNEVITIEKVKEDFAFKLKRELDRIHDDIINNYKNPVSLSPKFLGLFQKTGAVLRTSLTYKRLVFSVQVVNGEDDQYMSIKGRVTIKYDQKKEQ